MTTSASPRHLALQALAEDRRAQAIAVATAGTPPDDVSNWLADLQMLIGVPFTYLLPDPRMLPPESIRFFAIDPNWTAALTDGALSPSAQTAPGAAALAALRPTALATAREVAAARRSRARVQTGGQANDPTAIPNPPTYSGFLLRSAAVADWPGLQVRAYADRAGATAALPAVRLERLAPVVLLAVFIGLIQHIELTEPAQHMHFGVNSIADLTLSLRLIDQNQAGAQPPGDPTVSAIFRSDPNRSVLNVNDTVASITTALTAAYQPQALPPLGAAAFSLQLIQGTPSQAFETGAVSAAQDQGQSS